MTTYYVDMSIAQLEQRLQAIEAELSYLRAQLASSNGSPGKDDWRQIIGTFANDPLHAEAVRLGRKWRESQRPKPRSKSKTKAKRRR